MFFLTNSFLIREINQRKPVFTTLFLLLVMAFQLAASTGVIELNEKSSPDRLILSLDKALSFQYVFFPEHNLVRLKFPAGAHFKKELSAAITNLGKTHLVKTGARHSRQAHYLLLKLNKNSSCQLSRSESNLTLDFSRTEPANVSSRKSLTGKKSSKRKSTRSSKKSISSRKNSRKDSATKRIKVVKSYAADGLIHFHISRRTSRAPLQMHVLRIDPALYRLKIVTPMEMPSQRATLTNIAHSQNAIAAINAMYFAASGEVLGLLKVENSVVSSPVYHRAAVGMSHGNDLVFGYPQFFGEIHSRAWSKPKPYSGINHKRHSHQVMVYTRDYGDKTPVRISGMEYVVRDGVVIEKGRGGFPIPEDGWILSVGPGRTGDINDIELGDPLEYRTHLDQSWRDLAFAFSAGPLLLYNGQVIDSGEFENFGKSFINARHPRSAIGVTRQGSLILAVVDGRQPGTSVGLSIKEFAEILYKMGVYHAINLDGGGSSSIYLKDRVVNTPSGGSERRIANALVVLPKTPSHIAMSGN